MGNYWTGFSNSFELLKSRDLIVYAVFLNELVIVKSENHLTSTNGLCYKPIALLMEAVSQKLVILWVVSKYLTN